MSREPPAETEESPGWAHEPWFVDPEHDLFDQMGFSRNARVIAASGLARVYTPAVLRDIESDPQRGFGLALLLQSPFGWPGLLVPLLSLGLDLEMVRPWSDGGLLRRLANRREFFGAAFELQVQANLIRAGADAFRVPGGRGKTPDLQARFGLSAYEIEVKLASDADYDAMCELVDGEIRRALEFIPGANVRFVGAPTLGERIHDGKVVNHTALVAIAARIADRVSEIAAAGAGPGHFAVDDLGHVEVELGPRFGSVESSALPELPAKNRVARILRLVREAVAQFSGQARGVVVVGVHDKADLRLIWEAIRQDLRRQPKAFAKSRMVVFADLVRVSSATFETVPVAVALRTDRGGHLTGDDAALASAVAGRNGTPARRLGPAWSTTGPQTAPRVTQVSLGSVPLVPNATTTFRLDGSAPTITHSGGSDGVSD